VVMRRARERNAYGGAVVGAVVRETADLARSAARAEAPPRTAAPRRCGRA
jgi:hypothetical protein